MTYCTGVTFAWCVELLLLAPAKATNVRSNAEIKVQVAAPKDMSLDDCIEYITSDELVEVTPQSIRMRKNPKGLKGGKLY